MDFLSSDESSEHDEDPDYDADTEKLSGNEGSYAERLQKIKAEVTRLRTFVVTGLRGISRAGGEPTWEILAEQLDWGEFGNA
jgi:gamma-tubulin complex component 5